jgi:hypothetical protein
MDNVQKHNIFTKVPSSQTFRPHQNITCFISTEMVKTSLTSYCEQGDVSWEQNETVRPRELAL